MKIETAFITIIAAGGIAYMLAVLFATRGVETDFERIRSSCMQGGGHPVDVLDRDDDIIAIRCDMPMRGDE